MVALHWNFHHQFDPFRTIWCIISWSSSLHDVRLSSMLARLVSNKVSTCLLRLGFDQEWPLHFGFGRGNLVFEMLQIFSPRVVVLWSFHSLSTHLHVLPGLSAPQHGSACRLSAKIWLLVVGKQQERYFSIYSASASQTRKSFDSRLRQNYRLGD